MKNFVKPIALILGLVAAPASALSVKLYSDDPQAMQRASLNCARCSVLVHTLDGTDTGGVSGGNNTTLGGGMFGFSTVDGTSESFGELFDNSFGNNPAGEANWFQSVLGGPLRALTDANKTDPASDGATYTSLAEYVIIKVGKSPNYTILRNDSFGSGGSFEFTWTGAEEAGAGLSHFTEVTAAIPVPAAGLLLLGALGGLFVVHRRRRT